MDMFQRIAANDQIDCFAAKRQREAACQDIVGYWGGNQIHSAYAVLGEKVSQGEDLLSTMGLEEPSDIQYPQRRPVQLRSEQVSDFGNRRVALVLVEGQSE